MEAMGSTLGGRYRLLDVLGDGGMARVYRAEDQRLHRIVAVKILHRQYLGQAEFVRRFEQEAQLAAGLAHSNIVAIYDVGRDDESYYIVMEYVEGTSLKTLIAYKAPLPLDRTIGIMRQLGTALDFAHARGVIHRDVKPENILLTYSDIVKVSDFGIARAMTSPGQTSTGMVLGSVSYFSPEQAQGEPATAESDNYSSGIVLYEMLTGRLPFVADNPLATAMQHITQQPAAPRSIVPSLPVGVDGVVLKAISKTPRARFGSGADLADALAAAAAPRTIPVSPGRSSAAGVKAQAPTLRLPRVAPPPHRRATVAPLVLVVALGGGVAYAMTHSGIGGVLSGAPPASATPTVIGRATGPAAVVAAGSATPSVAPTQTARTVPPAPSATPSPTNQATRPAENSGTPTATPSTAPTATPSATPRPSQTPEPTLRALPTSAATAVQPGYAPADIITARSARISSGSAVAIDPANTFEGNVTAVYAVIRFRDLPPHVKATARWTFPNGDIRSQPVPVLFPTYVVFEDISGPGNYTVSVLLNDKVVATHVFDVEPVTPATPAGGSQDVPPNTQPQVFFASPSVKHRNHDRGHGQGDQGG